MFCKSANFVKTHLIFFFFLIRVAADWKSYEPASRRISAPRVPETGLDVAIAIRERVPVQDSSQLTTPFCSCEEKPAHFTNTKWLVCAT